MSLLAFSATRPAAAPRALVMRPQETGEILNDVRSIIAEQLGKKIDEVTPDSTFKELNADSLDTVEIMLALEEKFEVHLDEEGAENLNTVQEAAELIMQGSKK